MILININIIKCWIL